MTLAEAPAGNLQEWTVSGLSGALKRTLEDAFGHVRLRGEVTGFRGPHASGHCYFSLKDEGARIEAVIWKTAYARLKIKPQEGLEVIATGRVTTYPGSSKYQIVIDTIEPAGLGALMAIIEERRRRLAAEGLFDEARKRPLPFLPAVVGVVTSPTGAVIRDILHRLAERFPRHVLVWPVRVQGETSATEIAAAIRGFNALPPQPGLADAPMPRPDVLIVARGGGSLEDLWSFNEEIVVRAAAESAIPLVSAIGHETDWTLIDHAADLRCPTPTGAAEKVVPVRADLLAKVAALGGRQVGGMARLGERRRAGMRALVRLLPRRDEILAMPRQRLDRSGGRLAPFLARALDRCHRALARAGAVLADHSPRAEVRARRARFDARAERLEPALLRKLVGIKGRLLAELSARLGRARSAAAAMERERLSAAAKRLGRASQQLSACAEAGLERRRARVAGVGQMLRGLSYAGVLARGFALVRDGARRPVRSVAAVTPGMGLDIQFADGAVAATAAGRRRKKAGAEESAAAPLLDL